jgi:hypothetical protein
MQMHNPQKANAHDSDLVSILDTSNNHPDCDATENDSKAFATLAAQFALAGHGLHRTHPTDGPVSYFAERWGLVRHLPTLADAQRFLKQVGGAR